MLREREAVETKLLNIELMLLVMPYASNSCHRKHAHTHIPALHQHFTSATTGTNISVSGHALRLQDKCLLPQPAVSTTGSQGFSDAATSIWNKLLVEIRNSSCAYFNRYLKTYYLHVPSPITASQFFISECPFLRFGFLSDHMHMLQMQILNWTEFSLLLIDDHDFSACEAL